MDLESLIDQAQCPRLAEKYKSIAALPLDFPKFKLDDPNIFWEIWNSTKDKVDRQIIDRGSEGVIKSSLNLTQWDGLALYEDTELLEYAAWKTKVSPILTESQPNYLKRIFDEMPFVRIRSIRFWSAHTTIHPHYDGNMPSSLDGIMRFPTEIRLMLDDKNPKETFWLCSSTKHKTDSRNVPNNERFYVKLPADTNAFAWNNEDFLHGADFDPKYRKILVVIKGWVDVNRLEELLDRSIVKYHDYVIRDVLN